jgi:hypothetical protein
LALCSPAVASAGGLGCELRGFVAVDGRRPGAAFGSMVGSVARTGTTSAGACSSEVSGDAIGVTGDSSGLRLS